MGRVSRRAHDQCLQANQQTGYLYYFICLHYTSYIITDCSGAHLLCSDGYDSLSEHFCLPLKNADNSKRDSQIIGLLISNMQNYQHLDLIQNQLLLNQE